jgi:hypothetical protein
LFYFDLKYLDDTVQRAKQLLAAASNGGGAYMMVLKRSTYCPPNATAVSKDTTRSLST